MRDRELLELAAKAAGLQWDAPKEQWWDDSRGLWHDWNPLDNDGEALRLAVKLCMEVSCDGSDRVVVGWADVHHPSSAPDRVFYSHVSEPKESDPAAATRRAIVRAAAEIGKALA